jgi:SAM-dependent methyltransferase
MDKTSLRGCPICEALDCEVLHTQQFVLPEGHPLAEGYDVVCCDHCGAVYADTPVSQQDYDAFYRKVSKYQDDKTSTGGGESPWDARRLQETAATIAALVPERNARMVDIGSANGGLLHALWDLGFHHLTGLDPSPVCAANTRRHAGIRGEAGSLNDLPDDFGPFDCILLSHVLEHVQDLRGAMDAVRQLLADDGSVFIEVPDASRYADYLAAPFQDFNTEHINHFSLISLVNLARHAGLALAEHGAKLIEGPHPVPYPAFYACFRPARKPAGWRREAELGGRVLEYIAESRRFMEAIDERLRDALEASPELIVWGTGQLALKLLAETVLGQARIAAFVDGNPINHGRLLHGQRIIAPQDMAGLPHPIVITSILHESEIVQVIRDRLGLANPLITLAELMQPAAAV